MTLRADDLGHDLIVLAKKDQRHAVFQKDVSDPELAWADHPFALRNYCRLCSADRWVNEPAMRSSSHHRGLLLLCSDAGALPTERDEGWAYYQRNWRPGKPHSVTQEVKWAAA
ncbi:hypothetical protein [Roseomonas elaeocarpi]|uniref:Uncharacterized protein n=1 Tax=Roseomonas elaeocarpi TaxID=907779 RepID=A0ABV6JM22_9PROT